MSKDDALTADDGRPWKAVATRFVAARRAATPLVHYPGPQPRSLAEGYAVQDYAIALRGGTIGGWKIGRINGTAVTEMGADRLAGPIFADRIVYAYDGREPTMSVLEGGFAAAEGEFLLRIGTRSDPARTRWSIEEARALVDRVAIGIEIASSPLGAINDLGPAVTVSDFGNNNGLLVGPELPGWREADLDALEVALAVNGHEVGRATTATMLDGPWGSVRFLAGALAERGLALEPGQWISTGAVTGVHNVRPGDRVTATFADRMTIGCTITSER